MNKRSLFAFTLAAVVAGAAALASGCDSEDTFYYDYLKATGIVTQVDGKTAVPNIAISNYDWIVTFTDGSTIAVPFVSVGTTDTEGKFGFDSTQLDLHSGNLAESCTDVCLATATEYEDVCYNWVTEQGDEYCTGWDYDEWGDEYCTGWAYEEGETYCSSWGTESYEYCTLWGEDCEYYYPARDVSDIASAYTEITTNIGGATYTIPSSNVTLAADAYTRNSTTAPNGEDTIVDMLWTQNDVFASPLVIGVAAQQKKLERESKLNARQKAIVQARNAAKKVEKAIARKIEKPLAKEANGKPRVRKTRAQAQKKPYAELPAELQQIINKARTGCGATPKSSK
jgi:hypothetical protein